MEGFRSVFGTSTVRITKGVKTMCGNLNRNCCYCIHAEHYGGDGFTPEGYECTIDRNFTVEQVGALDAIDWDCSESPKICGHYRERIITHCECCNKNMNRKESECILAEVEDTAYVCSTSCKNKLEKIYSDRMCSLLLNKIDEYFDNVSAEDLIRDLKIAGFKIVDIDKNEEV